MLIGKRQKDSGFLLLEIMISISILSVGVLLIMNSFIRPIKAMGISMDYFKAGLLLEEKMFEVCNSDIVEGTSKSDFNGFNNMFSWEMDAAEQEEGAFKEIGLKVLWNERGKEQDMAVSTYL